VKIDMRWPDGLVSRLDERAALTGSNRSELVRRYAEAGLRADAEAAPTLDDGHTVDVGCGHEAELAHLKRELAYAHRQLEEHGIDDQAEGPDDIERPRKAERAARATSHSPAARSPFADREATTCGNGQHGKTTKAGNCERCGAYVGRS
jgi:hypothetical protein